MTEERTLATMEATREILASAGRPEIPCTLNVRPGTDAPLASFFDHTLLKPEATGDQYHALCEEARQMRTRSVCVPPDRVALCVEALSGSTVEVCTVIGFPLGYSLTSAKVAEVQIARSLGATEFDMVIPVGRLRDGDITGVYDDVRAVVAAADGLVVKVILETALLTDDEKTAGAVASLYAGAAILKTSTGFSTAGATTEDLRLFRMVAGETRGVKAAGGVRDLAFARECIRNGADRIGASATVAILAEASGAAPLTGGDGY